MWQIIITDTNIITKDQFGTIRNHNIDHTELLLFIKDLRKFLGMTEFHLIDQRTS